MIIVCQSLLKNTKILGIALFPFILLREKWCKFDKILINHERIHLRQQLELGIIFFYIWYGIEFLLLYIKFRNVDIAYHNISFEREAFINEKNLIYLKKRKFWNFLSYIYFREIS